MPSRRVVSLRVLLAVIITTAFFVVLASAALAQASSPGATVDAFDAALNAGNVDGALAQFAPDAVITTQGTTCRGTAQIRGLLAQLVAEHFQFQPSNRQASSDREAHTARVWRDDWRRLGVAPLDATAEVLVQNGKITAFTVAYTADSLARLRAAQAAATPPQVPRAGGPVTLLTPAAGAILIVLAAAWRYRLAGAA